ncbi:hypothetical protein GGR56DRAFT_650309 [Xylariaceae sp. FL0804]|nr:hypothetical protein GGR56DRAFT_650309 [Xylariaceae sp. FL0804]
MGGTGLLGVCPLVGRCFLAIFGPRLDLEGLTGQEEDERAGRTGDYRRDTRCVELSRERGQEAHKLVSGKESCLVARSEYTWPMVSQPATGCLGFI